MKKTVYIYLVMNDNSSTEVVEEKEFCMMMMNFFFIKRRKITGSIYLVCSFFANWESLSF